MLWFPRVNTLDTFLIHWATYKNVAESANKRCQTHQRPCRKGAHGHAGIGTGSWIRTGSWNGARNKWFSI